MYVHSVEPTPLTKRRLPPLLKFHFHLNLTALAGPQSGASLSLSLSSPWTSREGTYTSTHYLVRYSVLPVEEREREKKGQDEHGTGI